MLPGVDGVPEAAAFSSEELKQCIRLNFRRHREPQPSPEAMTKQANKSKDIWFRTRPAMSFLAFLGFGFQRVCVQVCYDGFMACGYSIYCRRGCSGKCRESEESWRSQLAVCCTIACICRYLAGNTFSMYLQAYRYAWTVVQGLSCCLYVILPLCRSGALCSLFQF